MPELKNMKLSPEERKEDTLMERPDEARYPYGLSLSLEDETLKKLGNPELKVGDYVLVSARAKVTRSNMREEETENGGTKIERDVGLQIEELGVEQADTEKAKSRYPTMSSEE